MLIQDLCLLINKYRLGDVTETPDYVLAQYLMDCLNSYEKLEKALYYARLSNNKSQFSDSKYINDEEK